MEIRPEEVNRFRSIEQAKAYKSARILIREVQESENRVKELDGEVIDINRSTPGDVLIIDGMNVLKSKKRLFHRSSQDIHLRFDPASGHVKDFEARKGCGTFVPMEHHYKASPLEKLGSFIGSFPAGMGPLGSGLSRGLSPGREDARNEYRGTDIYRRGGETVIVNHRTGIITDESTSQATGRLNPLARLGLKWIQAFCARMLQ